MTINERKKGSENTGNSELVSPFFTIDVASEMTAATTTLYPDYPTPDERLHMTPEEIHSWKERGGLTSDLFPQLPVIMEHPNYLRGVAKGTALIDDGTIDFSDLEFTPSSHPGGYSRDERGIPVRPFDELFLQKGALGGMGFYRTYGPNLTADPVVFREQDGVLQVIGINRGDSGIRALPGGMQDPNEPGISTAVRELFEEAGVDLSDVPSQIVHQGIVWSDTRSTRNAWPESTVVLLLPPQDKAGVLVPVAGSDAKHAYWMDVNEENLADFMASHASFVKLSVLEWQKITGRKVLTNGKIA
ncbi:MAG: NUDIX domain-containing protein [Candidatus Levybacteria bacterium]|nr:NUDIX domain-containing protein [Candidatus Levybacteria bacterium]